MISALALFCAGFVAAEPVRVIFDTDMGNDVDDAIALAELHALQTRGEARILAVTITKDNRWAPVFVDLLNTFYGRPEIPIGMVKHGATPDDGNYTKPVAEEKNSDGSPLYPRRVGPDAELLDAVLLLRKTLKELEGREIVPIDPKGVDISAPLPNQGSEDSP